MCVRPAACRKPVHRIDTAREQGRCRSFLGRPAERASRDIELIGYVFKLRMKES